jgi:hypothetical protein
LKLLVPVCGVEQVAQRTPLPAPATEQLTKDARFFKAWIEFENRHAEWRGPRIPHSYPITALL